MKVFFWESKITQRLQGWPTWIKKPLRFVDGLIWWPVPPLAGIAWSIVTGDWRFAAVFCGAETLGMSLKGLFKRGRFGDTGQYNSIHEYGLPSTDVVHATVATVLLTLMLGQAWWIGVALFPVLIGLARVSVYQHYPLDVIAGWILGVAWTLLVWLRG